MARFSENGIRLSSMNPSFLHSNSTSHVWPFSAFAEMIDNASDPGVAAKRILVDVVNVEGHLCLTFTDNGSGMTPNKLHKMLSFGFSDKGVSGASHQAIGLYGNGFKSGSMRLGLDALIFTKNGGCQSVGMLSQTYLKAIRASAVIVPIVPFNQQNVVITEDSEASLEAILKYSLLSSVEQLQEHFKSIPSKKGTKIVIWNIVRNKDGIPELDFDTDIHDIRMFEVYFGEMRKVMSSSESPRAEQNVPEVDRSLRAYLTVLYLKPRIQIILRGKKVVAKLLMKSLTHVEDHVYKPHFSKERVLVTFGLNIKIKDYYGIMIYHKNRLIKSEDKARCQIKPLGEKPGVGVIGIIECNFLKPAHNKQDFEYTKEFRLTLGALVLKLNDYCKAMIERRARENDFLALGTSEEVESQGSPMWLQCDDCMKWRRLPPGCFDVTPENFSCGQNPIKRFRSCSSPEEEENEDLLIPTYQKTTKKRHLPEVKQENSDGCQFQHETKQQTISLSLSESTQQNFKLSHSKEPSHIQDHHLAPFHGIQIQAQVDKLDISQSTEARENHGNTIDKRKAERALSIPEKKQQLLEEKRARLECATQLLNLGREAREPQTAASWEHNQESAGMVEELVDNVQQGPSLTSIHSLLSTQSKVVIRLSQRKRRRGRSLPLEGIDRETLKLKLFRMEKKVQRLRTLLGMNVGTMSPGTMTSAETETMVLEKTEIICHTELPSTASTSGHSQLSPEPSTEEFEDQKCVLGQNEQPVVTTSSMVQESLYALRGKLKQFLSIITRQSVDEADLSVETDAVDRILQQIIDANLTPSATM